MIINGVKSLGGRAARIPSQNLVDLDQARAFVENFTLHEQAGSELRGAIGSWPVRGRIREHEVALHELHANGSDFVPGLSTAHDIWLEQSHVCKELDLPFSPANAFQLAAVGPQFGHCAGVQGIRLEAPPHMSGWWLYPDDEFNPEFAKFTTIHLFHCIVRHFNIARFLALPSEHRFMAVSGMVLRDGEGEGKSA